MDFYKFAQHLKRYQELRSIPAASDYPQDINLSSEIWNRIKNLRDFTDKYNYEHSFSIFLIDNDIIITPITKGTKEHVISREAIKLEYKQKGNNNLFEKVVSINGKIIFRKTTKSVPESPSINYLFGIHSHPIDINNRYPFYSYEDYKDLQNSEALGQGLVTNELLLLGRTNPSKSKPSIDPLQLLAELNSEYLTNQNISSDKLNLLNLLLYKGNLRKTLRKQP